MRPAKFLCAIALVAGLCCLATAQNQKAPSAKKPLPLKLVQTIPLPGVEGRIDHMNVDVQGKRLFMAALGNQTVEIVDLAAGKPLHSIGGLGGDPEGIVYVPQSNLLFVAAGTPGVNIYDGTSYKLIRSVPAPSNDNLRYDPQSSNDYGAGLVFVTILPGLRALDSRDGKLVYDVKITDKGPRPEAFQVEKLPGSRRLFANMTYQGYIAVADLAKKGEVVAKWPVQGFKQFFPMALDEQDHRLFIGARNPAALVVFDTTSGKMVTSVPTVAHTDDLWYDAAHKRVYVSGGEGVIGVFEQRDPDHYVPTATVPTVPGASTSVFSPELNRLYVPTTRYAGQPAKVLVYEPQP
jgi:DNA-binding beta-propeller fold protein YncE